jgi:hypothetical protein
MSGTAIARIAALGAPVLCFDTCTALDLMRDPTRDGIREHERLAALALLAAAERGIDLVLLMADQVAFEFRENATAVENEAIQALVRLKGQISRIDAVAAAYGSKGRANLDHLDDHVSKARAVANRWIAAARPARQGSDIASRALLRLNQARTPARKGKDSMKDCVVIETYLDVVAQLRNAGLPTRIVFASSNTKDYAGVTGTNLNSDISSEFSALSLDYAPNLAAAKHQLGL